jgi:AbrB family looped-hinge helix DNA binding protein
MSEATITSKGQVTIPADIRRSLGLQAQDRLSFTPMPDGTVVLRAKTQSVMALKGMLKPQPGQRVAIKDMNLGVD